MKPFLDNVGISKQHKIFILNLTDDIAAPIQSNHLAVFVQSLSEQEYSSLPVYVANQFTLECINQHLHTINGFLAGGNQGNIRGINFPFQLITKNVLT